MYTHALRYEEFNGTVYNNVRLCSHQIKSMYSADDETKEGKCKEEGEKRRILDTDARNSCLRTVEEAFPSSQMISSNL